MRRAVLGRGQRRDRVALAGLLDLAHVAVVKRIEYDRASGTATVERELEGGLVEVLRVRDAARC